MPTIRERLAAWLQGDIERLEKVESTAELMPTGEGANQLPQVPESKQPIEDLIGRTALIDDPYYENNSTFAIQRQRWTRITPKTLKEVSMRDPLVSAIIQHRADTMVQFSRPEHRRFEKGFRIVKRRDTDETTKEELEEIFKLESFIYNCGRVEGTPKEDRMLFGEFLKLITRDALTIGHIAIEKIKTRGGALHRFRPVPAESMWLIDKTATKEQLRNTLDMALQTYKPKSDNDPSSRYQHNMPDLEYYKYVQTSADNTPIRIFGDEDMIWRLANPQNWSDSMGYCYSLLQLAIISVTNHLQTENYNANFFTNGYAARGILHLKGVSNQSMITNFKRQFYNMINGSQNSWRTPIAAGMDDIQWIPLSASSRDMEYINYNNHIMRLLCAQFQIDPIELGLDYLVSGTGRVPNQSATNEYKINYSRERGLYPLLVLVEDLINQDILPALDPKIAAKYKFVFTGYTDESAQSDVALLQAEMTVFRSMNDLLVRSNKPKIDHPIADVPLNSAFISLLEKNLTRGEIRALLLGDKEALTRKELAYIPGDPAFLQWNKMLYSINNDKAQLKMQKEQAALAALTSQAQSQNQDEEDK
jgi:hypothetical protein